MTEGKDAGTPPQDTGMPDAAETDPAALNSSEDLDEDRLRLDPLEEGMDPPERWAAADKYGTTPFEEHQGESLEQRVRQEQPDVMPETVPERPVAATPATDLDASIDELPADTEPVVPPESVEDPHSAAERRGQNADETGGSVAEALRDPDEAD